jgi:5-methylcytosine-specific restriction enzyme subunit McrC
MKKNNHIVLNEYKCLYVAKGKERYEKHEKGHVGVPQEVFDEVEQFVLESNKNDCYALKPGHKTGLKKVLQAQQFVGVIETKSGAVIEILPKITEDGAEDEIRKVFLDMLATLKNSPFLHLHSANLDTKKFHLLEVFIGIFLDELDALIKQGIRQNYTPVQENSPFLKGKLLVKEHLKKNFIHKERFFVEYDQFCANIPENRLIKSTLKYIYGISHSWKNQQRIRKSLFEFDQIPASKSIQQDFSKVNITRQMTHYKKIIDWCRIFLMQESFTTFKGDSVNFAILFDMNRIFEDYVAHKLKKILDEKVLTQVSTKHLVVKPRNNFSLRPDLLIGDQTVADTKWKKIKTEKDISQADMYQMYAYAHKYNRKEVCLIYPKHEGFQESWKTRYLFEHEDSSFVRVLCFDCKNGSFTEKQEFYKGKPA